MRFKNKGVLITGATGGIGNALVKKFVSLEGNVLATGTNSEKLDALKKEFPKIKIFYKEREKFMPERGTLDISKAKKDLNWVPETSVHLGIKKTWLDFSK